MVGEENLKEAGRYLRGVISKAVSTARTSPGGGERRTASTSSTPSRVEVKVGRYHGGRPIKADREPTADDEDRRSSSEPALSAIKLTHRFDRKKVGELRGENLRKLPVLSVPADSAENG